jgi:hypothetical protein
LMLDKDKDNILCEGDLRKYRVQIWFRQGDRQRGLKQW